MQREKCTNGMGSKCVEANLRGVNWWLRGPNCASFNRSKFHVRRQKSANTRENGYCYLTPCQGRLHTLSLGRACAECDRASLRRKFFSPLQALSEGMLAEVRWQVLNDDSCTLGQMLIWIWSGS